MNVKELMTGYTVYWYTSVVQSCPTRVTPLDCRTSGLPVLHYFTEFAQIHAC